MKQPAQTKQQKTLEDLKDFLTTQSVREEHQSCPRCGAPMRFVGAMFWVYGTDSGWDVRLPVCDCESQGSGQTLNPGLA